VTYSTEAFIEELYKRLKAYRIAYPLTQQELAEKSGVSLRSIQNIEKGKDVKLTILIKVISALGLQDGLLASVPDMNDRPSAHMQRAKGLERQRVRKKKGDNSKKFVWGDER